MQNRQSRTNLSERTRAICLGTGKQYHQSHWIVSLFVTCILIMIQMLYTLKSYDFLDYGFSNGY